MDAVGEKTGRSGKLCLRLPIRPAPLRRSEIEPRLRREAKGRRFVLLGGVEMGGGGGGGREVKSFQ